MPEPAYEEAGASFVTVFYNPKPEDVSQPSMVKSAEKDFGENAEKVFQSIKANLFIKTWEMRDRNLGHLLKKAWQSLSLIVRLWSY